MLCLEQFSAFLASLVALGRSLSERHRAKASPTWVPEKLSPSSFLHLF